MPPRRRRAAGNLSATPQSSSDSMDSIVYTAAQTAAPEASQDSVNVELDPKSPFVEVLTSDDEVTICDPPPIQPTHTAEVVIVSTPEKEANVSKLSETASLGADTSVGTSSVTRTDIKPGSLAATLQASRAASAARAAKGSPLVGFLTPTPRTGVSILDQALNDLRNSVHSLWMGNAYKIQENCMWRANGRINLHTLQWKPESRDRPVGSNSAVLIGLVGMVSSEGTTMSPDAGWQPSWGADKLSKQKRTFRLMAPGLENNIPDSYWERQWEGAKLIVENGRKLSGGGIGALGNCFVEPDFGTLRFRSPIFEPLTLGGEEGDSEDLPLEPEEDTPLTHRYATWSLSDDVRSAFDRVIAQGFEPQILEAYTRSHKLIHPNNVPAHIAGAIVLVFCTLDRAIFTNRGGLGRSSPEWQFYANLVKLQVLKQPPPAKSILSIKRKNVPGYGSDDHSDSSGSSGSAGPSAPDGPSATGTLLTQKSVRIAVPVS